MFVGRPALLQFLQPQSGGTQGLLYYCIELSAFRPAEAAEP